MNLANMCFPLSTQSPVPPFNPLRPTSWSLPTSWLSAMTLVIRSTPTARPLATSPQRMSGTYTPRPSATQAALPFLALAFHQVTSQTLQEPLLLLQGPSDTHSHDARSASNKVPWGCGLCCIHAWPTGDLCWLWQPTSASVPALHAFTAHLNPVWKCRSRQCMGRSNDSTSYEHYCCLSVLCQTGGSSRSVVGIPTSASSAAPFLPSLNSHLATSRRTLSNVSFLHHRRNWPYKHEHFHFQLR